MTDYRKAIDNLASSIAKDIKKDYCGTKDKDTLTEASERYVLDSVEQLKKDVMKHLKRK